MSTTAKRTGTQDMKSSKNKVIREGSFLWRVKPSGEGLRSEWQGDGAVTEA